MKNGRRPVSASGRFAVLKMTDHRKVTDHQNHDSAAPGQNLREKDAGLSDEPGQKDGGQGPHDEFRDAGHHGKDRIAHALDDGTGDMEDVEDGQADAHNGQVVVGDLKRLREFLRRAGDKAGKDGFPSEEHAGGDQKRGSQGDQKGGAHAFLDTPDPAGSQILAGVGDHGVAVRGGGHFQHAVKLVGGGKPGDKEHAEAVDHKLDDHAAHGDNRVLKGHGGAEAEQMSGKPLLKTEVGARQCQKLQSADMEVTEDAGNHLSDQRRPRGAGDAKPKDQDKEKIQANIDGCRHDHGV